MRGCLTVPSQPEGAEEPETNSSVTQKEEWPNTTDGKVIAENELDVAYKPEGSDPGNEPNSEEKEEKSDPEYAKMELHWQEQYALSQ